MYARLLVIQVLSVAIMTVDHFIDNLVTGAFLGVTAMSATGVVSQACLVPSAISGVISMGLYSVCSESMGAKRFRLGGNQLTAALVLVSVIFIPLTVFLEVFSDPLCAVLCQNSDASFIAASSAYTRGVAPSLYLSAVVPYLMYTCQMNRKSHWCSFAVGALFAINVGGDIFVALCTDWGIAGIGLATTIGALAAALILIGPTVSKKSPLHLQWNMSFYEFCSLSAQMISFGLPSAVTTLANAFAGMWVNYLLISHVGYTAVAAYTCASSVVHLVYTPASSLWYCTSIVTSVMLGKDMHAAIEGLPAVFTKIALMATVPPFVLALILAGPLCSLFIPTQPEVLDLAVICTWVLALNLLPNALITCFQSLLRSTGHRIAAVMLPAVYLVIFLPLLSWPLTILFGAPGVCAGRVGAYCLGIIALALVCSLRKKASPFKASTYVFLKPLAAGSAESDFALAERAGIEQTAIQVSDFFAKNASAEDAQLFSNATAAALGPLFAEGQKRSHCWVHAAMKEGTPWVQITCTRKTLNAEFTRNLELEDVKASYLDFAMLGAAELYTGDAPYATEKSGE